MVRYGAEGQRGRGLVWGLLRWVAVWWCGGLVWCGVAWYGVGVVVCGVVGAAVNASRLSQPRREFPNVFVGFVGLRGGGGGTHRSPLAAASAAVRSPIVVNDMTSATIEALTEASAAVAVRCPVSRLSTRAMMLSSARTRS